MLERFGSDGGVPSLPLYDFLRDVELLRYYDRLKNELKLRNAADLAFCEERDLGRIGMSRPEQKRLRLAFARRFPDCAGALAFTSATTNGSGSSSLVVKLRKKMFGGDDNPTGRESTSALPDDGPITDIGADPKSAELQHVIPADRIHLCRELGRGEFGCVYQAAWHQRDKNVLQVAVKRILPERMIANSSAFLQEAAIMTRMRHPNVVHLYGIVLDVRTVMLVSELAPCGSLLECLRCPAWREPFPVDTLCDFALQIAKGMRYLASQRLVHRDLAARNVLVTSPTEVKIADFGLSRLLGVDEDYYRSSAEAPSTRVPAAWCSPEAIQRLQFNSASDVWAFGVTLWEMFTYGDAPWANMSGTKILHVVDVEQRILDWPDACPEEHYALMRDCWTHDPSCRPTFDALCTRLPEIAPQLLMSAADSAHPGDWTYLQHRRGDIIVLLRKSPLPSYEENGRSSRTPQHDADLWLGALRCGGGGLVGLFQPHETVAYLGKSYYNQAAIDPPDNPMTMSTTVSIFSGTTAPAAKKSTTLLGKLIGGGSSGSADGTAAAEKEKERRKLLISQPQGKIRHTGHLGLDGHGFGLLNVDKKDLAKASSGASVSFTAPSCTFNAASSVDNDDDYATAPPRPPTTASRHQRPVQDGRPSERNNMDIMNEQSIGVQPPALPPKTYWRRTAPMVAPSASNSELDAHVVLLQTKAQKCSAVIRQPATLSPCSSNDCHNDPSSSAAELPSPLNRSLFEQETYQLQNDITNFSLNTSDRRPLIGDDGCGTTVNSIIQSKLANFEAAAKAKSLAKALYASQRPQPAANGEEDSSAIRPMTSTECDRWREQAANAQKKAARSLERQRGSELARVRSPKSTTANKDGSNLKSLRGPFTTQCMSGGQPADEDGWSEEAQAAYKLLVQFGDRLKSTDDRFAQGEYGSSRIEKSASSKPVKYINPENSLWPDSTSKNLSNGTLVSYSNGADRSIEPLVYRNYACENVETVVEEYVNSGGNASIDVTHYGSSDNNPNWTSSSQLNYNNAVTSNGTNLQNETVEKRSRAVPPAVPPKPRRRNVI